jgi:hypothetical protein
MLKHTFGHFFAGGKWMYAPKDVPATCVSNFPTANHYPKILKDGQFPTAMKVRSTAANHEGAQLSNEKG